MTGGEVESAKMYLRFSRASSPSQKGMKQMQSWRMDVETQWGGKGLPEVVEAVMDSLWDLNGMEGKVRKGLKDALDYWIPIGERKKIGSTHLVFDIADRRVSICYLRAFDKKGEEIKKLSQSFHGPYYQPIAHSTRGS